MAEERVVESKWKDKNTYQNEGDVIENGEDEDEPDFSDPEGFVDEISDEGC